MKKFFLGKWWNRHWSNQGTVDQQCDHRAWQVVVVFQNGKASLGDELYRAIASEHFSAEHLVSTLDIDDEHNILEMANRLEAAVVGWRRRIQAKSMAQMSPYGNKLNNRTSWGKMRHLVGDTDRRALLAERAESVLISLKQRVPGMAQTVLDANKIQFNRVCSKPMLAHHGIPRIKPSLYQCNMSTLIFDFWSASMKCNVHYIVLEVKSFH